MSLKLVLKTGNGIIPTGNGINSHASYPQIWRKKFYYKMFIIFSKEFKTSFENNYWIMQTGELG